MRFSMIVVMAMTLGASEVLADDNCKVPKAEWQSVEALKAKLAQMHWDIARIKSGEGCYEVYGHNAQGKRVEVYFNPKTLTPVEDIEN